MFYILSHVIPGLPTFLDGLLTGNFRRKPYIFQSTSSSYLIRLRGFMHFFWFYNKKITLNGDVETNRGPKSKRSQEFPICHWNLNSIATYSFKLSQWYKNDKTTTEGSKIANLTSQYSNKL